jgi:aminopeptidase N
MSKRHFKYQREDFSELPVEFNHLDIHLSFWPDRVEVAGCLHLTAKHDFTTLALDAKNLDLKSVERLKAVDDPAGQALSFDYRREDNQLIVDLAPGVSAAEEFRLRIGCVCHPNETLLEGIYHDTTPKGAPQQFISQCQQWGFQRIMPILDDCRAKCTMTTTLEADAAYTHLISNGNIDRASNPSGKPEPKPGDPGRQVITFHNPTPMAPYLFIAAAGTWDELVDEISYPDGKTVRLEYLVPPGKIEDVRMPMDILKESILWIHKSQGYQYQGDTYRTITMNRSNFGGMENVGNTTIVTDAALIDKGHTLDASLLYAHAVIVHEFEHNQCGSETTMETPFDVWLNEAYTVVVERDFMADQFDPAFIRLRQVDSMRDPLLGPLVIEDGGQVGRIVRQGFNDPDELIDGVTYVKAAEVIRMLRLLLGRDNFNAGRDLYFRRYHNGNANSNQFFDCFQEVSGCDLEQFKSGWLYTIGYPKVKVRCSYDQAGGCFNLAFQQEAQPGQRPFHLPIDLALVDEKGQDIPGTAQVFELKEEKAQLSIQGINRPPAFASINRDCSFYGSLDELERDHESLILQARLDPNPYNRVEAMRRLTDQQRVRLMQDPGAEVDSTWLEIYGEMLAQGGISPAVGAYLLRIETQPLNRDYLAWYPEQVAARERLLAELNQAHRQSLLKRFRELDTHRRGSTPKDGIEERLLKAVLLDILAHQDDAATWDLILDHYHSAVWASDRVSALSALNRSSSPKRLETMERAYQDWHDHLSGYANYLRVVSSGTNSDVFERISAEAGRESFDITQPTWCRALYLPMAANIKIIWTEPGIAWLAERIIQLAALNPTTASRLLNAFQLVRLLREPLRTWAHDALKRVVKRVSGMDSPTIAGQAKSYLSSLE